MASEDTANTDALRDPIASKSLLWPVFWATIFLMASAVYSIVDEVYIRRPYKGFQSRGVSIVQTGLRSKLRASERALAALKASPEYRALNEKLRRLEEQARDAVQRLNDEMNHQVLPAIGAINETVKVRRSMVKAATYSYETAHGPQKKRAKAYLDAITNKLAPINWFGKTEHWAWPKMLATFNALKGKQAAIQGQLADVNGPITAARKARANYVKNHMQLPKPDALRKLIASLDDYRVEIKQIHVQLPDGQLVERCESCHIAIRFPVELKEADVEGQSVYTSHPLKKLLEIHKPEKFGCTPCHNGNGLAVSAVEKAHGNYEHWLHPLFPKDNLQAGCLQCHRDDRVLAEGEGIAKHFNRGRQLFIWRGCRGCHRYVGVDRDADYFASLEKSIATRQEQLKLLKIKYTSTRKVAQESEDEDQQLAASQNLPVLQQKIYLLQKNLKDALAEEKDIRFDTKKVAPNLKEIRAKLKPEWVHAWLMNPRGFRPSTKMPRFRLGEEDAWNIAAFIWQSALPVKIPPVREGDAEHGHLLFNSRGCLGCHTIYDEELEEAIGDGFSADLSREGEKAWPAYTAAWITNPRAHNARTVMPNLRLSRTDVADITAYLSSRKDEEARYPSRADALKHLTDKSRFAEGRKLVINFGCAGCHEISGLETQDRIGTELTKEGSKPIERLDFARLTHEAEMSGWYDHKGFFERKLKRPNIWDRSRYFTSIYDKLRMPEFFPHLDDPRFNLKEIPAGTSADDREEIEAENEDIKASKEALLQDVEDLTTYLMGSVDEELPPSLKYDPRNNKKAVQDGWWVVKKYNCDGCHQIVPGKRPKLWDLPWYNEDPIEGVPGRNARPPTLVGEGARVRPVWLMRFLGNPALTNDPEKIHRNGVREGFMVRMPTFQLSKRERTILVRFFVGLADLWQDYTPPEVPALKEDLLDTARAVFVAGDCFNCHLLGTEARINPDTTYAPNFRPVAERIRPSWFHQWITKPNSVIPRTAMPALLKPYPSATGGQVWRIDLDRASTGAKKRLTPREMELIRKYQGDHADLLGRYFAHFNLKEARFLHAKRAIH